MERRVGCWSDDQYTDVNRILNRAVALGLIASQETSLLEKDLRMTDWLCPLDFSKLVNANDFNFYHDVQGIMRKLNRTTGVLQDSFDPRSSLPVEQQHKRFMTRAIAGWVPQSQQEHQAIADALAAMDHPLVQEYCLLAEAEHPTTIVLDVLFPHVLEVVRSTTALEAAQEKDERRLAQRQHEAY